LPVVADERDPSPIERDSVEFGRAIGFFDATFAIAATLLVTTLVPADAAWTSWSNFWSTLDGPLLAFAISFWLVAAYWWGNHRFVATLRGFSPRLVVASLIFLAFVVLVPFSTRGFGTANSSSEVTTVVYAINVALVSAMATVLPWFARADDLFAVPESIAELRIRTLDRLSPTIVFLGSIPIALLGAPSAARYFWLLLIPLGYFGGQWSRARIAAIPGADELSA
jgi:uncharacterized membrane protein